MRKPWKLNRSWRKEVFLQKKKTAWRERRLSENLEENQGKYKEKRNAEAWAQKGSWYHIMRSKTKGKLNVIERTEWIDLFNVSYMNPLYRNEKIVG